MIVSTLLPNRSSRLCLLALTFIIAATHISPRIVAQDILNDAAGRWENASGAVVRLRSSAGEMRNTNATLGEVRNFGTIEFCGANNRFSGSAALGRDVASRIGGIVRYTSTLPAAIPPAPPAIAEQNVQARWYSNLELDGTAIKRIPSGVYIGGDSPSDGRFTANGGTRLYEGTFYFDNAAAQDITGGEAYQNLEIQRGVQPKRVRAGTSVVTRGAFRQATDNNGGLHIHGTLRIGTNAEFPPTTLGRGSLEIGTVAGVSVFGTLHVGAGQTRFGIREVRVVAGILAPHLPTAEIIVQTGATLRLSDLSGLQVNALGRLSLTTASHTLRISGALRNDRLLADNTSFHPQSLVIYEARRDAQSLLAQSFPQEIMRTLPHSPYGNLQCDGADKIIAAAPNLSEAYISVAGSFRMNGGVLDVAPSGNTSPDSSGVLLILNPEARVEYSALAEVRGSLRRITSRAASNYVFNNAATRLLAGAPSTILPDTITVTVFQNTTPLHETSPYYEPEHDVRRRIVVHFSEHPERGTWEGNLQLGYRASEIMSPFRAPNEQYIAFFAAVPVQMPASMGLSSPRRIATTRLSQRNASEQGFGVVEQFSLSNDASSPFGLRSGEIIIMRGKRELVYSQRDGRWSNPLVWNILREPLPGDSVEIRHAVHIGFRRFALDGTTPLGQIREQAANSGTALAASVSIAADSAASLVLGSVSSLEQGFDDERPPLTRLWNAGTIRTYAGNNAAVSTLFPSDRAALLLLREGVQHPYRGLMLFTPQAGMDSTTLRLDALHNEGIVINGMRLETTRVIESTGYVENRGTLVQRGEQTLLRQASIGGWVRFESDVPQSMQIVPSCDYERLALSGRAEKQVLDTLPLIVRDSLFTESIALLNVPNRAEINLFGGMLHNGSIYAPGAQSLVRCVGARRQYIQGFGAMDGLSIENPFGVDVLRIPEAGRGLVVRSHLNLVRGAFHTQDRANVLMENNALISRRAESSLASEPLRVGRIRLRTLGARAMTATGELPSDSLALTTLEVLNNGGYTLNKTVHILDSLAVVSRIMALAPSGEEYSVVLRSLNPFYNPSFLHDSAEIVGTMRRTILPDTITRIFHNRYTSFKLLNPASTGASNSGMVASMRVIPHTFPAPHGDSTKVRRNIQLTLNPLSSSAAVPPSLLARIGYAWDTESETNSLDASRIALQLYDASTMTWNTPGVPFRPTIRSLWNRLSESGIWQYGAMDSIPLRVALAHSPSDSTAHPALEFGATHYLALSIDSALSVLPSAFLNVRVLLEGAFEPAHLRGVLFGSGSMSTTLAAQSLLPARFDSTETAQIGNFIGSRTGITSPSITDWLLVELRPLRFNDSTLWIPALVRSDGLLLGAGGETPLRIELPTDNEQFLVFLHHRNHLSIALSEQVRILPASRISLDFTHREYLANAEQSARAVGIAPDGHIIVAMRSGDVFGSEGVINRFDYDAAMGAAWNRILSEGYQRSDADLNGIITTKDLNRIWNNRNSNAAIRKP